MKSASALLLGLLALQPRIGAAEGSIISADRAWSIGESWVAAFNSHDLDAVLKFYAEDVELRSPVVIRLLGDASGKIRGKVALRNYFAKALRSRPDLRFELLDVFAGVGEIALYYRNMDGRLIVETMALNDRGLVTRTWVTHEAQREL